MHLNVDPGTEQYQEAAKVASRLPALTDQATGRLLARLPGPAGRARLRARRRALVRWRGGARDRASRRRRRGGRAAGGGDEDGAQQFADSVAAGTSRIKAYRDVQVQVDHRGVATALVGGFLAIGTERGVQDVIDADSGARGPARWRTIRTRARRAPPLPDDRLADAYLSKDGIARARRRARVGRWPRSAW